MCVCLCVCVCVHMCVNRKCMCMTLYFCVYAYVCVCVCVCVCWHSTHFAYTLKCHLSFGHRAEGGPKVRPPRAKMATAAQGSRISMGLSRGENALPLRLTTSLSTPVLLTPPLARAAGVRQHTHTNTHTHTHTHSSSHRQERKTETEEERERDVLTLLYQIVIIRYINITPKPNPLTLNIFLSVPLTPLKPDRRKRRGIERGKA